MSMCNYFVDKRKEDKQRLLKFLVDHPDIPQSKALGLVSANTGLAITRLEVYLKELKQAELIA